jgi:hypothetical protein
VITVEEIEAFILKNRAIVGKRRQPFDANPEVIKCFFAEISKYDGIFDTRKRLIKKAAYLLAGLAWNQFFKEGNKETATHVVLTFLNHNGLDLDLAPLRRQAELYKLLKKTIEKFEKDKTIYSEVEGYLKRRVVLFLGED